MPLRSPPPPQRCLNAPPQLAGAPPLRPANAPPRPSPQRRGGCLGIPSWGKFWLAVLGVYQWEGVNSLFPEMALLPRSFPLHTCRMWSYCRTVYMPMSYIYGRRFSGPTTPLVEELREELVLEPCVVTALLPAHAMHRSTAVAVALVVHMAIFARSR